MRIRLIIEKSNTILVENHKKIFKTVEDLDHDGDDDYIYVTNCAESNCLKVFINKKGKLVEQIHEFTSGQPKPILSKNNQITLTSYQLHCCGESPFTSKRTFEFELDSFKIIENFVEFTFDYYAPKRYSMKEIILNDSVYYARVLIDNYNLRYCPDILAFTEEELQNDFFTHFTCEPATNIIAKLFANSIVKVLSERVDAERSWLYIEAGKSSLNTLKCLDPLDFDFPSQKIRGWISDKFVKR